MKGREKISLCGNSIHEALGFQPLYQKGQWETGVVVYARNSNTQEAVVKSEARLDYN